MLKVLITVVCAMAGAVAVIGATVAVDHSAASVTPVSRAPQHVTLQVASEKDSMIGSNLVVHPGRIVLTIINRAHHSHLFTVPALGIQQVVLPATATAASRTTIRFTVPRGVFHWFCALPCHTSMSGDVYATDNPPHPRGALWAVA